MFCGNEFIAHNFWQKKIFYRFSLWLQFHLHNLRSLWNWHRYCSHLFRTLSKWRPLNLFYLFITLRDDMLFTTLKYFTFIIYLKDNIFQHDVSMLYKKYMISNRNPNDKTIWSLMRAIKILFQSFCLFKHNNGQCMWSMNDAH